MATIVSQPESNASGKPQFRKGVLTGIQVLGVGSFAPDDIVRNEDLVELGYDPDWIVQRTGILERRRAPAGMATSDMAYEAARRCLDDAGVDPSEVDLIVVATTTPDTLMPSTACLVQGRLGSPAGAMDINAACTGFMYALITAAQFVKTGSSRRALVIGADLMSRFLNPEDRGTFPLFGDAAGAALLGTGESDQGLLSFTLGSDGDGADLLSIPGCGSQEPASASVVAAKRQFMQMEGRAVFKWAVRTISETIIDIVSAADMTPADIDLLVLHQANVRIIDAAVDCLGIDREKVVVNLDRYGNTSAGSIPLALDEAQLDGRIERGDNILLCGFGAGLTWGSAVLKW